MNVEYDFERDVQMVRTLVQPPYRFVDLLRAVSDLSEIDAEKLIGHQQTPAAVRSWRKVLFYMARHRLGLTMGQIGRLAGDRDHSTVSYNIRAIRRPPAGALVQAIDCLARDYLLSSAMPLELVANGESSNARHN